VRTPVLLIAVVGLVLSAALTVFGTAFVVEKLKDMLLQDVHEEARLASLSTCQAIEDILARSDGMAIEEAALLPEIIASLERLSGEAGILIAEIRDAQGRVLCQSKADLLLQSGMVPGGAVAEDQLIPVSIPLHRNGELIGVFQMGLSRQLIHGRIELLGAQITSSLLVMVLIVFAILLLTMVLVYVAFVRQMSLTQRAAEAEHLADLGALASGLAHEVRNPLHAMNLHLEVVREDLDEMGKGSGVDAKEASETICRVQQQIERLNGIVSHFLNLSLPCRLTMAEMRLDGLVREVTAFLEPDLAEAGVQLQNELGDEAIVIYGDRAALHQVLLNVLINSRKALASMPEGHERVVRLRATREKKVLRLLVEDSGPGIPVEEREVIFRAFVSKRCGGTGVGLSIARKIMDGHGGAIYAGESELGGAVIALEFPDPKASHLIPRQPLFREPSGSDETK
jgi:signal transduction histidine kinase